MKKTMAQPVKPKSKMNQVADEYIKLTGKQKQAKTGDELPMQDQDEESAIQSSDGEDPSVDASKMPGDPSADLQKKPKSAHTPPKSGLKAAKPDMAKKTK